MRIGPEGKRALRDNIKATLDQKNAGVPEDGIVTMLTLWVIGLLENVDKNPNLREELEK